MGNNRFNLLEFDIRMVTEISLLDKVFIDPITRNILEILNQPTEFTGMLIYGTNLLVDDYYKHPNSIEDGVIKGFERVNGMVYKTLITAIKNHKIKNEHTNAKLGEFVKEYAILDMLNSDSSTNLVDDVNPIAELKMDEEVSPLGFNGRSMETMTKPTRGFHKSE